MAAKRRNYWDQKAWGGTEVGEGGVAPHPPLRMSGVAALEIVGQSPALWFVSGKKMCSVLRPVTDYLGSKIDNLDPISNTVLVS